MAMKAAEAWELLLELLLAERIRVPAIAAELGLSAVQCHVIRLLDGECPVPMGRLAATLGCDASNVTGIVDRLEARGLLERRTAGHDRRVKAVVLTGRGAEVKARLVDRLAQPPAWLGRLTGEEHRLLCAILRKARAASGAGPAGEGSS